MRRIADENILTYVNIADAILTQENRLHYLDGQQCAWKYNAERQQASYFDEVRRKTVIAEW
jgi:hypothetical protein